MTNTGGVPIKLASITDGLSNTIVYGEHAHGLFSQKPSMGIADFYCWNWWTSGNYGDTLFTTLYPINPQNKIGVGYMDNGSGNGTIGLGGDDFVLSASSFHPGGANFAFMDGSVHFIKDSVGTWQLGPRRTVFVPRSASRPTPMGLSRQPAPRPDLESTRPSRPATAAKSSARTVTDGRSLGNTANRTTHQIISD